MWSCEPHAGAPMSHHASHGVAHPAMCEGFLYGKAQLCSKRYHGSFLYFCCNWLLFFSDSGLHHKKPLTMCAYINPFCRVCISVTGSGSPVQQSSAALQPCDVHGHETCVFSGQNSRYPQSSRFPQLSCAKPLKSIVFLLWPCAFDFLNSLSLETDKPEAANSKHEHEKNASVQLCAGHVPDISHINIGRINTFVSWHSHQPIFILKLQLHF